jgi:hypothetical protein
VKFGEAMAAASSRLAVRRDAWGARRAVQLQTCPWNGEREALLLFDRSGRGDVPAFPYTMSGEDVLATDWSILE